jgi:hypothetical protein
MSKSKEFVDIVVELYTELESRELDITIPIEIWAPWATSIFIQQNQQAKPAWGAGKPKAPDSSILSVTGELEVKGKPKQLDNGKTQYSIKVNGEYYNTLGIEAFKGRKFDVGDNVTVKYRQNGKYKNLVEVLPAEADENDNSGPEIPF